MKRKRSTRFIAFLLAAVMLCLDIPSTSFAAAQTDGTSVVENDTGNNPENTAESDQDAESSETTDSTPSTDGTEQSEEQSAEKQTSLSTTCKVDDKTEYTFTISKDSGFEEGTSFVVSAMEEETLNARLESLSQDVLASEEKSIDEVVLGVNLGIQDSQGEDLGLDEESTVRIDLPNASEYKECALYTYDGIEWKNLDFDAVSFDEESYVQVQTGDIGDWVFYKTSKNEDNITLTDSEDTTTTSSETTQMMGKVTWGSAIGEDDTVTLQLTQNGTVVKEQEIGASDNWSYTFTDLEKYDSSGNQYEYAIDVKEQDGFEVLSTQCGGVSITMDIQTQDYGYDYAKVYYKKDGKIYSSWSYYGSVRETVVLNVPSDEFWIEWKTNYTGNNYYGFALTNVSAANSGYSSEFYSVSSFSSGFSEKEVGSNWQEIQSSSHNPYADLEQYRYHYKSSDPEQSATTFNIKKTCNLDITHSSKKSVSGMTFQLLNSNKEAVGTWTFDDDVKTFEGLDAGKYMIQIISPSTACFSYPSKTFNLTDSQEINIDDLLDVAYCVPIIKIVDKNTKEIINNATVSFNGTELTYAEKFLGYKSQSALTLPKNSPLSVSVSGDFLTTTIENQEIGSVDSTYLTEIDDSVIGSDEAQKYFKEFTIEVETLASLNLTSDIQEASGLKWKLYEDKELTTPVTYNNVEIEGAIGQGASSQFISGNYYLNIENVPDVYEWSSISIKCFGDIQKNIDFGQPIVKSLEAKVIDSTNSSSWSEDLGLVKVFAWNEESSSYSDEYCTLEYSKDIYQLPSNVYLKGNKNNQGKFLIKATCGEQIAYKEISINDDLDSPIYLDLSEEHLLTDIMSSDKNGYVGEISLYEGKIKKSNLGKEGVDIDDTVNDSNTYKLKLENFVINTENLVEDVVYSLELPEIFKIKDPILYNSWTTLTRYNAVVGYARIQNQNGKAVLQVKFGNIGNAKQITFSYNPDVKLNSQCFSEDGIVHEEEYTILNNKKMSLYLYKKIKDKDVSNIEISHKFLKKTENGHYVEEIYIRNDSGLALNGSIIEQVLCDNQTNALYNFPFKNRSTTYLLDDFKIETSNDSFDIMKQQEIVVNDTNQVLCNSSKSVDGNYFDVQCDGTHVWNPPQNNECYDLKIDFTNYYEFKYIKITTEIHSTDNSAFISDTKAELSEEMNVAIKTDSYALPSINKDYSVSVTHYDQVSESSLSDLERIVTEISLPKNHANAVAIEEQITDETNDNYILEGLYTQVNNKHACSISINNQTYFFAYADSNLQAFINNKRTMNYSSFASYLQLANVVKRAGYDPSDIHVGAFYNSSSYIVVGFVSSDYSKLYGASTPVLDEDGNALPFRMFIAGLNEDDDVKIQFTKFKYKIGIPTNYWKNYKKIMNSDTAKEAFTVDIKSEECLKITDKQGSSKYTGSYISKETNALKSSSYLMADGSFLTRYNITKDFQESAKSYLKDNFRLSFFSNGKNTDNLNEIYRTDGPTIYPKEIFNFDQKWSFKKLTASTLSDYYDDYSFASSFSLKYRDDEKPNDPTQGWFDDYNVQNFDLYKDGASKSQYLTNYVETSFLSYEYDKNAYKDEDEYGDDDTDIDDGTLSSIISKSWFKALTETEYNYPEIRSLYVGSSSNTNGANTYTYEGQVNGGGQKEKKINGVLSVSVESKDEDSVIVTGRDKNGKTVTLSDGLSKYVRLKNVTYKDNTKDTDVQIPISNSTSKTGYSIFIYDTKWGKNYGYIPKFGVERYKDSSGNIYVDYADTKESAYNNCTGYSGTISTNTKTYGRDYYGMYGGFDFTVDNTEGVTDFYIHYKCELDIDLLKDDYPELAFVDSVSFKDTAYVNYQTNYRNEVSSSETTDSHSYAVAPSIKKKTEKKSSAISEDFRNNTYSFRADIANDTTDSVNLSDQLSEMYEEDKFGTKGDKYTDEQVEAIAEYMKLSDLKIYLKNNNNASKSILVASTEVQDDGNVVIKPSEGYEITTLSKEDTENIPYDSESGYPITGNIFNIKIKKSDGSTFDEQDYFDASYKLTLDDEKQIAGKTFRELDFYKGGKIVITNQASISYQWNDAWVAAGSSVDQSFLRTSSTQKSMIKEDSQTGRISWEVGFATDTAGKTGIETTLVDKISIPISGISDDKKETVSELIYKYLDIENVKYYISDQLDIKGTKTEITEDSDVEINATFKQDGTYDGSQYTGELFTIKLGTQPFLKYITVDYDTVFDWDGFSEEIVSLGLLSTEELKTLKFNFDNYAKCDDQTSYVHASSKQWAYPAELIESLNKKVTTKTGGSYTWDIDYVVGNADKENVTISDNFTNTISNAEYGSLSWIADIAEETLASSKKEALSKYWLAQFVREYSLINPVTVTVSLDGTIGNKEYSGETLGTFTFGGGKEEQNVSLLNDKFNSITGETITVDTSSYGFILNASKLIKGTTIHLNYTTTFDTDKYGVGDTVVDDGMSKFITTDDDVDFASIGNAKLHNDVTVGNLSTYAETNYKPNHTESIKKSFVGNDKLDTMIFKVDVDTDYLSGTAREFTISDTIDEKYSKHLTLTDIGVIYSSGDTQVELENNAEENWSTYQENIKNDQMALNSLSILNDDKFKVITNNTEKTISLNDARTGLNPVANIQGFNFKTNGANGRYQRTTVVYKLQFDFDKYAEDGNTETKLTINNQATLNDKYMSSSNGDVQKKELFEKKYNSSSSYSGRQYWDISVNLSEEYTQSELEEMKNFTITDVFTDQLINPYVSSVVDLNGKTVNESLYEIKAEGQTLQMTFIDPKETPNVTIRVYATPIGTIESMINKASLVVNNKKITTESETVENVDGLDTSNGWIRGVEGKTIRLTKTDSVSKETLQGVEFSFTDYKGDVVPLIKDDSGYHYKTKDDGDAECVSEVTTNAVGEIVISGLPIGKYYFTETKALDGYIPNSTVIDTEITADSPDTTDIEVVNEPTRVQINKFEINTENFVIGAHLAVYNVSDVTDDKVNEGTTPIDSWTTTNASHEIDKLTPGKYVLVEESAPSGYIVSKPVTFTVEGTSEIQKVNMEDDYTKVKISKKDHLTGLNLAGAKLQLLDKEGVVVKNWTSGLLAEDFNYLPAGTYYIHEVEAPLGYALAEDVEIEVKAIKEPQEYSMEDYIQIELPSTGSCGLRILLASATLIFLLAYKKRRRY